MAEPIPLEIPPRDPRAELIARLEAAPAEHAEALLAAYDVLGELYDQGLLEIIRAAVASKDDLMRMGAEAITAPEVVRGLRNAVLLLKVLGSIDPSVVRAVTEALPQALAPQPAVDETPGLLAVMKGFANEDSRRGLAAMQSVLQAFGRGLKPKPDE